MRCFHCGEEASSQPPITLELDGQTREFCCYGCRSVCETIHQEGLTGFYQHRTAPAVTPKSLTASELEQIRELDHPLVQQSFVLPVKGGMEAQLLIEGITCAACIWLLENHLTHQSGVRSFSVNHTTQRARLVWSPEQTSLSELVIAIHELGYTARPYKADEAEQALKAEKRSALIRLCVAGIGTVQSMMLAFPLYFELINDLSPTFIQLFRWFSLLVATPVVLYSARPFFQNALRDIRSRHLTMDVPVATAIGLAYLASAWVTVVGGEEVYFESVCMFTFLLSLGRYIEMQARYRAGLTGNALAGSQPQVASRKVGENIELVATHELCAGDVIVVKPGETLPVDGVILSGQSTVNEAALTGEYLPETRTSGDLVHAGSVNGEHPLHIRVEKTGASTRLSGILRILDRVQSEKPQVARMADRVAGMFVSRILILAPLVWIGWWLAGADNAFDITLSVLVVTCPCALSLATPTAITSATVKLRKLGFLPTRGHTLELLHTVDTVVFDKTGTLTEGKLSLVSTHLLGPLSEMDALELAAGLEQQSEHPIAQAFSSHRPATLTGTRNHVGGGLTGTWQGQSVAIGHIDFVAAHTREPKPSLETGHGIAIWLASESQWLACFVLDDRPRQDADEALKALHTLGIRTVLLSGDRSGHVAYIANLLGLDEAYGQATPEDKLARLRSMQEQGHHIMMVGDGLNDLPSMAGASISVAMGSAADLTQLRADAVLLNGQLRQIVEAIRTSNATRRVIRQNMTWALGYNLCALPLAAAGMIPPWLAAIGMSLSSLVVVLNALRLGKDPNPRRDNTAITAGTELSET
ncbi:heavy metal translocating P-type ATPase [Marinobacter mobilis]|uniref:Cu2+-exporting ATPase n=1 Tax=Marinobacter mobilis TaxID=488533 RepID=A0A1H2UIY2_9GAMM|nr:heavy metal translocating P-type ATPase [Marinobacter mobilis]SDW56037.1 Cu2+-exporting ATPase [Marinobacter mobilis]